MPLWAEKDRIHEALFCQEFLKHRPLLSVSGAFYSLDGLLPDEGILRKEIYDMVKPYLVTGIAKKVGNILEVLRMECGTASLPMELDRIHVHNGTYFLDGHFEKVKTFCRHRLPVTFNPDAPTPQIWLQFLTQLLQPEDILTLQEFLGYCFLPTTKAQKMLLLIGDGGEGKSRIGIVLKKLMGSAMMVDSISKIEHSAFARADLEHHLLMVDDDMKLEALKHTNILKSVVTAELPMDLERKGMQSYQGTLVSRILAFANGNLQSIHDHSYGFFRRQIILRVKKRPAGRQDDPFLGDKLEQEAQGIFLWCLEGLHRLRLHNYHFTESQQAQQNIEDAMQQGNNMAEFMQSQGYFRFRADCLISTKRFYNLYLLWCSDNAATPLSPKGFSSWLKQNTDTYRLEYTNKVSIGNGKYARGYIGIEPLQCILP